MPLFSSRGFNQATQAGFQQGFAAQVQMMLQARAEQIQRDLQNDRLKADAEAAAANREAQVAAQDKQIAADMSKTQYTEGMANNRQAMDLESKKLADSQRSSDETMRFLMGQNFTADENAKQRAARASEFDITRQDSRDAAAQASMDRGEQIGLQREQIGMQKDQQKFARERATKEDTFRAADIIGKAFERKDVNAQRLQEHAMSLYAGGQDSVMKAYAARAADPANPNSAADLAELKRLANASPAIIAEAAHKIAVDDAMSFIQSSDDPSIAILKDVAPDAVRSALDTHLKAATQRRESAKTDQPAPTPPERTDLGPLDLGKSFVGLSPEDRSKASRGEVAITAGGKSYTIEAPTFDKTRDFIAAEGSDGNYEINASRWKQFTGAAERDKYIKDAYDKIGTDRPFDRYVAEDWSRKKLIKEAYKLWYEDTIRPAGWTKFF